MGLGLVAPVWIDDVRRGREVYVKREGSQRQNS